VNRDPHTAGDIAVLVARISGDGQIVVPAEAAERLQVLAGTSVEVRVTPAPLAARLRAKGIADTEVDLISAAQLEARDAAARFLLSEGAMRRRTSTRGRR
jgi:bifunctional DNA-binding transcriptional regulator/antitoxin component of YhaV-PrlF toxin-antitoxin module